MPIGRRVSVARLASVRLMPTASNLTELGQCHFAYQQVSGSSASADSPEFAYRPLECK